MDDAYYERALVYLEDPRVRAEARRIVKRILAAGSMKPRPKTTKPFSSLALAKAARPSAKSQRMSALDLKRSLAKRLGIPTPVRYDEET